MLTEAELLELESLEREATAGPWRACACGKGCDFIWRGDFLIMPPDEDYEGPTGDGRVANRKFIAAARNALPELLAACRERDELRRQVEAIREAAKEVRLTYLCIRRQLIDTFGDDCLGELLSAIAATEPSEVDG